MTSTRRTARRRQRFLPAALLFLGTLCGTPAAAQLSATPTEITLVPGSIPTASITVQNEGTSPQQALVYLNDWDRDDKGGNQFYPVGTTIGSCGDRVKVFPSTIRLEAGARQALGVSIEGAEFRSPCWTVVFVETTHRPSTGATRIVYVTRVGVKVYVVPPNLPLDAEITGFALEHRIQVPGGPPVDTTQDELALRVHNIGGQQAKFVGRIEIRDLQNKVVSTINIDEFPVLPGAGRRFAAPLPTLPPGKYIALAVVSYGGEDDLAAQLELEIH